LKRWADEIRWVRINIIARAGPWQRKDAMVMLPEVGDI